MEKETLDLRQITGVLGKRPFAAKSNFKAYLEESLKPEEGKEKEEEPKVVMEPETTAFSNGQVESIKL